MSEVNISSDESEDSINTEVDSDPTKKNRKQFDKLLKLCQNHKEFPLKYIQDIDKMYKKCSNKKKNSTNLCNLIVKGIKLIPQQKSNSFQYVADVYNELLELSKKDSTSSQVSTIMNYCSVASTSNKAVELKSGNAIEINKINKTFKELIEKCYENPNFSNSNIKVVDDLYKSLPSEFVESKYFVAVLEEANNKIWPDSSTSLYHHIELIHDQLNQFKSSMEAKTGGPSEITGKKLEKLKQLKVALKKVRKKIKDLDEADMDIAIDDDFDTNSSYVLKNKYEKRALDIYKRMCKLSNEQTFLEVPLLHFTKTNNKIVNKTIEKYYNRTKTFPDHYEILTLLKVLREKKKFDWSDAELSQISQDAFIQLGKQLKARRLKEYYDTLNGFITGKDPAEENPELKMKLDKNNKKMHADLCAIKKKFIDKQEAIEETDGSSLNNTDCEISSEDGCDNLDSTLNKNTNLLPVKRKRIQLSDVSDDLNLSKKSKVSMSSNLEPKHLMNRETTDEKGKKNVRNSGKNLENNNLIEEGSTNNLGVHDTITKILQENIYTNNDKDNGLIITEPEVLIQEDNIPCKDVIEINELDDSDVEITESSTPTVPVQNKESLENIIKSMNFEKRFNWGQQSVQNPIPPSTLNNTQTSDFQQLNNVQPNGSNFVNRWVMNNNNLRTHVNSGLPNYHNINHLSMPRQRMQSSFQKSSTQTSRQATQRFLNPFPQQRNYANNQSVLSQRVTTMTTTTTVRHIIHQQPSGSSQQRMNSARYKNQPSVPVKKNNKKPDLIELD